MSERDRQLPLWLKASLAAGGFLLLNWLERKRPLRRRTQPKLGREIRNIAVGGLGGAAMQLMEVPMVLALFRLMRDRRWGLLGRLRLPLWADVPLALVLMDYTYYVWHILLHRVPLLWRFHLVHHVDLDMDKSTALRFHFGEMVLTAPFRLAQVACIGLTPLTYSIWQIWFVLCILFHHSDVDLPFAWEQRLNRFIVTPRMHGIHHSIVREETESNWSSGLTIWDRLHGTLRLNVPQGEITIGVPGWRAPDSVTLPRVLALPFESLPPIWEFPWGGEPAPYSTKLPADRLVS